MKTKKRTSSKSRQKTKTAEKKPSGPVDDAQAIQTSHISELESRLSEQLQIVLEILDLKDGDDSMLCAGDLVAFAIDSQWLEEKDFLC
jgi:serine/threonine-protein kinase haspin